MHQRRWQFALFGVGIGLFLNVNPVAAVEITDSAGDFLPSYTGPKNADLDVTSAQVSFQGATFRFDSTMSGPIGTTPTGLYVWGIDRGAGTHGFPTVAPEVTFDSLFIINPAGSSFVRDLVNNVTTPVSDITVSGDTVSGVVLASALPSLGLQPWQYLVNLWPRSGAGGLEVISDFAPDNSDAPVTNATPEPGTFCLMGFAGFAVWTTAKFRKRIS